VFTNGEPEPAILTGPNQITAQQLFLPWYQCGCWFTKVDLDPPQRQTRGVSHYGLVIYMKKHLKAKELRKLKYFTMQKYNLQNSSKKKPKSFKILQLCN
jgi:hypothetical protein